MEIEEIKVSIRELTKGYIDNEEGGVFGFDGKLNIRPPYQREFVYNDKEREAVIDTVLEGFPLSLLYWSVNSDGTFEVIDGQQRTISICQYINNDFSHMFLKFDNQPDDIQQKILDYELSVCLCKGTDSEKLKWFERINISGKELTKQELLNAIYHGPWVSSAKQYFSKTNCPASRLGKEYLSGSSIRQDYLETAIKWISKGNIPVYMSNHQQEPTAVALWNYFQSVIEWTKALFPKYRPIMKGIDWGYLYNLYHNNTYDPAILEEKISMLLLDDDVTNKKGIYQYLFTGNESHLNIRAFTESQKIQAYEQQKGICPICHNHFNIEQMEGDHIIPWCEGGKTEPNNLQMLCRTCNRRKSCL